MCVDGLGYVYVCETYVVHDECDDPPPCLCSMSVHMVVYFSFLCEFCFLYCDDIWFGAGTRFSAFDLVSDAVYVDLKYDDVFVFV